jgi:hypothetical protein
MTSDKPKREDFEAPEESVANLEERLTDLQGKNEGFLSKITNLNSNRPLPMLLFFGSWIPGAFLLFQVMGWMFGDGAALKLLDWVFTFPDTHFLGILLGIFIRVYVFAFVFVGFSAVFGGFISIFFMSVGESLEENRKSSKEYRFNPELRELRLQLSNAKKYEIALENWEYYNMVTKQGYWEQRKGIQLEHAVAHLLGKKGWNIKETKVTGDGGIDLVSTKGDRRVLIQCKGHKSALGVGAIRDAAGVKATEDCDDMVVIAPNGFTNGSINFARNSGIVLVSSHDLSKYASDEAEFPRSNWY